MGDRSTPIAYYLSPTMADRVGFEPTRLLHPHAFQACSLNRSDTCPSVRSWEWRVRSNENLFRTPHSPFRIVKGLAAHPRFDRRTTGGIGAGGSKQVSYGARRKALTVAAFRPWRGSRRAVA